MVRKPIQTDQRCQEKVPGEGQWGYFHMHQCSRKWSVVRNGKCYCKQHDPDERERKREERSREWHKKWDEDHERRERERLAVNCHDELVAALKAALVWVAFATVRDTETTHPDPIQHAKDDLAKIQSALAKVEGK